MEKIQTILQNKIARLALILGGGLLVLLILGSLISNAVRGYQNDHLPTATLTATTIPTATPRPPTAVPPIKPIYIITGQAGEELELSGTTLTVLQATNHKVINERSLLETPLHFLDVEVQIENRGTVPLKYDSYSFRVQNGEGYIFTPANFALDPQLSRGELEPGKKITGHVVFEINDSANQITLSYFPLSIREQNEIKVKLTQIENVLPPE